MRPSAATPSWALLWACALAGGCVAGPAVGERLPGGGGGATGASFSSIRDTILTPRCATSACHSGSPPANNVPVSLDAAVAWAELVSIPSTQLPSLNLVEPGSPGGSYLVAKLRGTHALDGGTGAQMPIGEEPLTEDELTAVEAWISNGAPND